ncbi:unnamed protein product [Gadus morhua 'NCC']
MGAAALVISDHATVQSPVHYHPVRISVIIESDAMVGLPRLGDAFLQQCLEVWVAAQVIVECSSTVTLSVRVTSLGLRSAIPMGEGTRRYRQSECRLLFS